MRLEHEVDVVLMDVRMPEGDGLTALGRIKLDKPDLPIVMFSAFDNPAYVARAVALGASGYLLKGCTRDELVNAITKAAAGENVFTRDELRRVTGAMATPRFTADIDVPLTQREAEVLRQMANGLTNKDIAETLHISYETVKEHVQHILAQDWRYRPDAGSRVGRTQGTGLGRFDKSCASAVVSFTPVRRFKNPIVKNAERDVRSPFCVFLWEDGRSPKFASC